MKYTYYQLGIMAAVVSFLGFVVENIWLAMTKGYINNRNMNAPFLLGYGLLILFMYAVFGTPAAFKMFTKEKVRWKRYLLYFLCSFVVVCIGEIVLLAGSLKIGAILAGATAEDAENLYKFGMQIGVAFQLQDDLLDVYGDPEVFGKKIGGDILCNKKTYMLIKALDRADAKQREELNRWLDAETCQSAEKIKAVTELYNQLDIRSVCENKMRGYYTLAMESLAAVGVAEERKKELKNLVKLLMYREM